MNLKSMDIKGMDTIFMNSGNSKTSDPYRRLLNISGKRDLNGKHKDVSLWNNGTIETSK